MGDQFRDESTDADPTLGRLIAVLDVTNIGPINPIV